MKDFAPAARNGAASGGRLAGARGMRIVATGLLLVMAAIYIVARSFEGRHPAIGFIRSFAEAGMVGGLADWFAVTALFRHPMGLPIPHTAIIPRNKDRIGDTLGLFLRDNFLIPRVVARRMRGMDVAGAAGRFLVSPSGSEGRLRRGASRMIGDVIEALDDERLGGIAKAALRKQLDRIDAAPMLGQMLGAAMTEGRHGPIIDAIVRWAGKTLEANEHLIRQIVHDRANSIMRWTGLDEKLANAIVDGLTKLLVEMEADPLHPLRIKAEEGLARLADDLQTKERLRRKVALWKDQLLANPAIGKWINGLWEAARRGLLKAARNPDAAMAGSLGGALVQLGTTLQSDANLKRQINRFARRAAVGATSAYGDPIVRLVSDTIRGWDVGTVTGRIEQAVGRDLQYIRINGTLVGGLLGVALHAIGMLL